MRDTMLGSWLKRFSQSLPAGACRHRAPARVRTLPSGSAWQSFALEIVLTLFLMFVVLSVSTGAKEKGVMAGVAVGSVIALEALFAGPISGASMNPARSLAPALVAGKFDCLWVYLSAPFLGAGLSVIACRCVHEKPCCCVAALEC